MNENDIYKSKYYKYKNKYIQLKNIQNQEGGSYPPDLTDGIIAFIGNSVFMHEKYDFNKQLNCLYKKGNECEVLKKDELVNLIDLHKGVIYKNNDVKFYEAHGFRKINIQPYMIIDKDGKPDLNQINKLLEKLNSIPWDPRKNDPSKKINRDPPLNWILIYNIKDIGNNILLYSSE